MLRGSPGGGLGGSELRPLLLPRTQVFPCGGKWSRRSRKKRKRSRMKRRMKRMVNRERGKAGIKVA